MGTPRRPRSAADPAIRTVGLTKRFGSRIALDGAALEVPRGCAYGFLGPNGAGKTTFIRTLLGLTRADSGSMELLGLPVPGRRAEALTRVGAIVEEPRFHGHLTGRENLLIAAAGEPAAHGRIVAALHRMELAVCADDRVRTYSMGMRQRLGIARCLLADPELLILDEPTNGLDPAGILAFRAFVRELVADGCTVFLSSHLLGEIEKTCDAAAIVHGGRVLLEGPIARIAAAGAGASSSTATTRPRRVARARRLGRAEISACARHDSNMRPLPPQGSALSPELRARRET